MFGYVPRLPRPARPAFWAHPGAFATAVAPSAASRRTQGRGIIIDLDDTLYPRERFVRSGLAAVAKYVEAHHGIPADTAFAEMLRTSAVAGNGFELQALCARFGLPTDLIPGLVQVFRAHTPSIFLGAAARDTLTRLRADGWAIALLTNGLPSVQFRKVAALGLAGLVDEIIYAEEHAPGGKPAAATFKAAMRVLELPAERLVCVGDDPRRDVQGARALGLATIRVARAGVTPAAADEADLVIESLTELPGAAALVLRTVTADVA